MSAINRVVVILVLIATLLAACGQGESSGPTGSTASSGSSSSSSQPTAADTPGGDAQSGEESAEQQEKHQASHESRPAGDLASLTGEVLLDGSSTVYPISAAVAEEFISAAPDVRAAVGVSGTGGGFKKFCNAETVISGASRPIKDTEIEACTEQGIEFVELPVAYDGLSVMVNMQNDWVDCMTVDELKQIWAPESQGQITSWNQIRADWPTEPLSLYGPGTDSGTFDYFTDAIVGEEGASRGDYTASEDDNVLVNGISGERGALGYFGYAYYAANQDKLRVVAIDSGDGCITPSEKTINNGSYHLSRPIFIYVRADALDKPEIAAFVEFYLDNAAQLSSEVGYVALPAQAYQLAKQRVAARTTGSTFSGGNGSVVELLTTK